MNPEIKSRWLAALRSGKYEQGRQHLVNFEKFCCLGVLCDILDPEGWDTYVEDEGREFHHLHTFSNKEEDELSKSALSKFGFSYEVQNKLVRLNDGYRSGEIELPPADFLTIANWIEENL